MVANNTPDQTVQIVSLQKDVESVEKRVVVIETKQDRFSDYVLEIREILSEQRKTNEYMGKVIEQNSKFMEKIDLKYEKNASDTRKLIERIESKYDKDIEDNKEKIHNLELVVISENNKQDDNYNKEKFAVFFKILGITLGIISFLGGAIWKLFIQ